jgi:CheY-like chemotaxis protein
VIEIGKILIADDESPKLESIAEFVTQAAPKAAIHTSRSVRSTLEDLQKNSFDLLILDMSLPTFDVAPGEKGGRAQNLGGEEVLRYMEFYGRECPVVIVTQFDHFFENGKHVGLSHVASRLKIEHPSIFRRVIHYGGSTTASWRAEMLEEIKSMQGTQS